MNPYLGFEFFSKEKPLSEFGHLFPLPFLPGGVWLSGQRTQRRAYDIPDHILWKILVNAFFYKSRNFAPIKKHVLRGETAGAL